MKWISRAIAFILLLIGLYGIARADVYVITDSQSEVYSISNAPDAVVPKGYTLSIIKGQDVSNLPITGNPQLYNYANGSFMPNVTAVQAQQKAQQDAIAQQTTIATAKASGIAKLKAIVNLTDDEIKSLW